MSFWNWIKYFFLVIFVPHSLTRMEWQMLIFLNRDRKDFALWKLFMQDDLRVVARKHSKDMAKKDYFEHTNIKGQSPSDRLKTARVTDSISGENLAKIGGYPEPVLEAEEGLMRSPGHRANILNKNYNCVGIGIIKSKQGVYYFTQNFAKRIIKFTRKVRKNISIKNGLRLKGYAVEPISEIYYQVSAPGGKKIMNEGGHKVESSRKFNFTIKFDAVGNYEVQIFTLPSSSNKRRLHLSNSFEVSVRSWWF